MTIAGGDKGKMYSSRQAHPIERAFTEAFDVDVTTAIGTTETIDYRLWKGGSFSIPSGSSLTTLTFWGGYVDDDGTTFEAAKDEDNAAIVMTVAADARYPFPVALQEFPFVRVVGNAAGTLKGVILKA